MIRTVLLATLVAGTLDILSAFVFAGMAGMSPTAVLGFVASGPFGDAMLTAPAGVPLGLLVHFAIMACMASAYVVAAERLPVLRRRPIGVGLGYGVLLWLLMYFLVRPLRWPAMALPHTAWGIGNQLFSHCILVGLPIALIAARRRRGR